MRLHTAAGSLLALLLLSAAAAVDFATLDARQEWQTKSLYVALAKRDFSSVGLATLNTLYCRITARKDYFSSAAAVEEIVQVNRLAGPYLGPDPFALPFARMCPEMLAPEVLEALSNTIDEGG